MKKTLAIVTVVYESYTATNDFLASLAKQKNKDFHLYLADLSKNKQEIKTNLPITILESTNLGYAHGVNLGLKKALKDGLENFCIINNDVFFNDDFVEKISSSIIKHSSSIIGGKIYYAPGYEFHKIRYQKKDLGKVLWYAGGKINWNHVLTPHRGVDEVDKCQYNHFEKNDFVTGCLMCFDKRVIDKIGYLDESYFLYYEDADYCERAKRKNINLFYDPSNVIWHKNAQSTQGSGSNIHQKFQRKSRLKFGFRYAPIRTKIHLLKEFILNSR